MSPSSGFGKLRKPWAQETTILNALASNASSIEPGFSQSSAAIVEKLND